MIDRQTVDRILDSVRIEEVIGDFISLRKKGTNYWGLCPFHQDKHASMAVSATKGIFKCFSCGKAGTAVSFLMEHEHLSYPEALKYLANKYHIEIVEKEESPEESANRQRHESLLIVNDYAQKFYQDILWNNDYGRAVGLSYFRQRKFTDETIRKFGLGFACSKPVTITDDALKKGYKAEYLVETGLTVQRENGELADRFYERVMFPIHSISGRVIAFGGRTLRSDKNIAKYVNSPQSEIYDKSRSLYGIYFAKSAIIKSDKCILVEGYADVISMHQSGIENVVASSGTSLTIEQIRLIKRFSDNITIIYDGDEAGIKAAIRGTDMVLEEGLNVKIVLLPPEDDPDSYAKSHTKDETLNYIAEHEQDFISYKSDLYAKAMASDPLNKARLINDIIKSISVIPDPILRNVYVDMVAERFDQESGVILHKIAELREKKKEFDRAREHSAYRNQDREQYDAPQSTDILTEQSKEDVPANRWAITDPLLKVPESEIIYHLLKFGSYIIHFEENMIYGSEDSVEDVTVEQYIGESLECDDIVMSNLLYRSIYEEYIELSRSFSTEESCEERQQKVIRHFTTHQEQAIARECISLTLEEHPLTVKEFKNSIVPEEQLLAISVPKSIFIYKARIADRELKNLQKRIMEAQHEGDHALLKELVEQLQMFNQVKNNFTKLLNRM